MPEEIAAEVVGAILDVGSEVAGLGADATRNQKGDYTGCSGCLLVIAFVLGFAALAFYFWG